MGTLAYGTYVARGNCRVSGFTVVYRLFGTYAASLAPTRHVAH
jgi:hypothetical protein